MNKTGIIYGVNGPVIYLKGDPGFKISEMVYVGPEKLVGEVISLDKDLTTVQVYEETSGLCPGEEVIASGSAVASATSVLPEIHANAVAMMVLNVSSGGSAVPTNTCPKNISSMVQPTISPIFKSPMISPIIGPITIGLYVKNCVQYLSKNVSHVTSATRTAFTNKLIRFSLLLFGNERKSVYGLIVWHRPHIKSYILFRNRL